MQSLVLKFNSNLCAFRTFDRTAAWHKTQQNKTIKCT